MEIGAKRKRLLVLASGDVEGGGSGFQEMVEYSRTSPPALDADIVGVISNHPSGGVYKKAMNLKVPFEFWNGPFTAEAYRAWVEEFKADYVMLSGWLKFVRGLDPARTINIHPGPLPRFGGPGFYGHHVHEPVMEAYWAGEIIQSEVNMHFVLDSIDGSEKGDDSKAAYDRGPVFFKKRVLIREDDTPETLAKRVNEVERTWQSIALNQVIQGHIFLHDGQVRYTDHFCKKLFFLGEK
jgi:phosphoribosylglycinamide formyltransferase-1